MSFRSWRIAGAPRAWTSFSSFRPTRVATLSYWCLCATLARWCGGPQCERA
ncbi:hypothetical protein PR001_g8664 [Phytophthora rubi]|uniref:Uncharacterized protein n=1 Tax=Phytophthora rubi TaxID=129364 RepID=A0A6A3N8X7_9STRA|nr:hypothetical protein PR001_g8664 [Phytophthora rubi]KAE9039719.1 hypothetical protein PR002_g5353 [Phytophthora rubi]